MKNVREPKKTTEGNRLPNRAAALVCAAAFLLLTYSCQAQQTLQLLHNHLHPAVANGDARPVGHASPSKHLHLAIQLPLRHQDELKSLLARLYDPASPDFRKYLSVDEFTENFGPTKDDYQQVINFVKASGMKVMDMPKNRLLVEADGTMAQAEKAFHVTMKEYQHPTEKRTFYSPDREPSLALSVPVTHISGLNNYVQLRTRPVPSAASYSPTGSGPDGLFLPHDVRMAYYGNGPLDGSGQSVGLVTFWGFNVSDVNLTYTSVGLKAPTVPIKTVLLGGLTTAMTSVDDGEPITDIVAALSIAPNLKQVREYQCCGPDFDGSVEAGQDVIYNSMATENICKQISESAGVVPQHEVDDPYFEEMAAQGQSFFAASGDAGSPPEEGFDSYSWYYPGDNAWITSVGATTFTTKGAGGAWVSEFADDWSGGGISNGPDPVNIPSYQIPVINAKNGGSKTLRNVPDVAALGGYAYLCDNGDCGSTGGTSYSSPLWASFMALVNQQATKNGQPTVGFLNPILYKIGQSANYSKDFHDMVGGKNDCCGQAVSYPAVAGYDLVTGWGTPKPALINDLLSYSKTSSFTLMASSNTLSIGRKDSGAITLLVGATGGFTGNVALAVSGLPKGVTASFGTNPTSDTKASVLTLTASGAATLGNSTITITGASGGKTASTTLALTVTAKAGNFDLGHGLLSLSTAATFPGSVVTTTITVTSEDNFNSAVALSAPNLPTGIMAEFSPSSVTPVSNAGCTTTKPCATSTLKLYLYPATAVGVDTITVAGTSGSLIHSDTLPLEINSAGSGPLGNGIYTVKNGKSGLLWKDPGSSSTFNTPIVIDPADNSTGEQWAFTSIGGSLGSSYYSIQNVNSTDYLTVQGDRKTAGSPLAHWGWNGGTADQEWKLTPSGNGYILTSDFDGFVADPGANTKGAGLVQQKASGAAKQVWLINSITALPDFTIAVASSKLSLTAGGSATNKIAIASLNSFDFATKLTVSGLPAGVKASFSANPVTPSAKTSATTTLTLTSTAKKASEVAAQPLASSSSTITVTATAGPLTHKTTFSLVVK
jgi:hypothetical protein